MIDLEREQLERDPAWRTVLETYRTLQAEAAEKSDCDGWVARIRDVDGVALDDLSVLHGRLIALGLLKFELAGRTDGLRYQLTRAGKQLLNRADETSSSSDDDDVPNDEQDESDA